MANVDVTASKTMPQTEGVSEQGMNHLYARLTCCGVQETEVHVGARRGVQGRASRGREGVGEQEGALEQSEPPLIVLLCEEWQGCLHTRLEGDPPLLALWL